MSTNFSIRKGKQEHIPDLLRLIHELADYECAPGEVENSEVQLLQDWQKHHAFDFLVALTGEEKVVGMALYYPRYSTWKGRCFYLEDLYVQPEYRGNGVGLALLKATADEACNAGAIRIDWQVLDWNEPAVKFYGKLGAYIEKEWWNCKLNL